MTEEESRMEGHVRAYYGIVFLSEDPGVLEASCSHATSTDPRKGKTKQMDWTEARELSTLSQK